MAENVALMGPGGGRILKEDSTYINEADRLEEKMGGKGLEYIANTAAHNKTGTACYCMIYVLTTAALTTLTPHASAPITGTITGVSLPAGTWIYGKFTTITLASGSVIAYNGTV